MSNDKAVTIMCNFCKEHNSEIFHNHLPKGVPKEYLDRFDCRFCNANLKSGKLEEEFIIITSRNWDDFRKLINKAMKYGYRPLGKIVPEFVPNGQYSWTNFHQSMLKQ